MDLSQFKMWAIDCRSKLPDLQIENLPDDTKWALWEFFQEFKLEDAVHMNDSFEQDEQLPARNEIYRAFCQRIQEVKWASENTPGKPETRKETLLTDTDAMYTYVADKVRQYREDQDDDPPLSLLKRWSQEAEDRYDPGPDTRMARFKK